MGARCIVIEKELITHSCPLPDGECTFKHRITGMCKYSKYTTSMTVAELAALVGVRNIPNAEQQAVIIDKLKNSITEELQND